MITTAANNTIDYIGSRSGFNKWYAKVDEQYPDVRQINYYTRKEELDTVYYIGKYKPGLTVNFEGRYSQFQSYCDSTGVDRTIKQINYFDADHNLMNIWCRPEDKLIVKSKYVETVPRIVVRNYCKVSIQDNNINEIEFENVYVAKCMGNHLKNIKCDKALCIINCSNNELTRAYFPYVRTLICHANAITHISARNATYIRYDFHHKGRLITLHVHKKCILYDGCCKIVESRDSCCSGFWIFIAIMFLMMIFFLMEIGAFLYWQYF